MNGVACGHDAAETAAFSSVGQAGTPPRPNSAASGSIHIPSTRTTPEVIFDFERNFLALRGESYPENVVAFYLPILERLQEELRFAYGRHLRVEIALTYFNSSSTKVLFRFFDILGNAVQRGAKVDIHWFVAPGDDNMLEFCEDFQVDCPNLVFHVEEIRHA